MTKLTLKARRVLRYQDVTTTQPDRCREVADWIEANTDRFDMSKFLNKPGHHNDEDYLRNKGALDGCGTTACIAGWAVHLYPRHARRLWVSSAAREILGLTRDAETRLFYDMELRPSTLSPSFATSPTEARWHDD